MEKQPWEMVLPIKQLTAIKTSKSRSIRFPENTVDSSPISWSYFPGKDVCACYRVFGWWVCLFVSVGFLVCCVTWYIGHCWMFDDGRSCSTWFNFSNLLTKQRRWCTSTCIFGKKKACIFLEQHFLLIDNICHLGWFSNVEVLWVIPDTYIISTISTGDLVHLVVGYSIIV